MHKALFIPVVLTSVFLALGVNPIQAFNPSDAAVIQPGQTAPVSSHLSPAKSPQLVTQQSRVRRIQFEPGAYSATLEDAVVRGTRDIFLVGANQGQTMTVRIASIENNASFAILSPPNKAGQRRTLTPDAVKWSGVLPNSGDYQVIIGSSRGNASYKLHVQIK